MTAYPSDRNVSTHTSFFSLLQRGNIGTSLSSDEKSHRLEQVLHFFFDYLCLTRRKLIPSQAANQALDKKQGCNRSRIIKRMAEAGRAAYKDSMEDVDWTSSFT